MGGIPDGRASWEKTQPKLEAQDGRDHREPVDGDSADPKTLHATDRRMGYAGPAAKLPLAQSCGHPDRAYFVADTAAFPPADARSPTASPFECSHPTIVNTDAYPAIICGHERLRIPQGST